MNYKCLKTQVFTSGVFALVPIRHQDRYAIMQWRNEQIYHLRQSAPLTPKDQDAYFETVVSKLFNEEHPDQILFSFLEDGVCIGYGGLVHINWIDKNAEISFIMKTALEKDNFEHYWIHYLNLIEKVAFENLRLHKIFTYAFDIRPQLYGALLKCGFYEEAKLKQHSIINEMAHDAVIHAKINHQIFLKKADKDDVKITFKWASSDIVRQFSFQKNKISWESHSNWFLQKLANPKCRYYILRYGALKVGSMRIDFDDSDQTGLISYLIDPKFHRMGLGKSILEKLETKIWDDFDKKRFTLKGFVLEQNIASVKIFHQLNYQQMGEQGDTLIFEKEIVKCE